MDCVIVQARIGELLDGEACAEDLFDFRLHLETCAACAGLASEWSVISQKIRTLPRPRVSAEFDRSLDNKLSRTSRLHVFWPKAALVAIAASIIVAVIWFQRAPEQEPPRAAPAGQLLMAGLTSGGEYCDNEQSCRIHYLCEQPEECGMQLAGVDHRVTYWITD